MNRAIIRLLQLALRLKVAHFSQGGVPLLVYSKMKKTCRGKLGKNINWKGEEASYQAKHIWMINNYGSPIRCDHCGKRQRKSKGRNIIQWANISGKFKRERSDWMTLCVSCHKKYDYRNGAYHVRGEKHCWSKLNEKQVKEIRQKHIPYKHGNSIKIAEQYNISTATISAIIRRLNWKHL